MKLARVMTAMTVALTVSSLMGGVALAKEVCLERKPVNEPITCIDPTPLPDGTGYVAVAIASATRVTVTVNVGRGTVRADTTGFNAEGESVANAAAVQPGTSDSDDANPQDGPIVEHDLQLLAG